MRTKSKMVVLCLVFYTIKILYLAYLASYIKINLFFSEKSKHRQLDNSKQFWAKSQATFHMMFVGLREKGNHLVPIKKTIGKYADINDKSFDFSIYQGL